MMDKVSEKIWALVEPVAKAGGFDLVRVNFGGGGTPTLQIMAERPDGSMSIDDCAKLSSDISALLDAEDPLAGEYLLEVSSPGIDRPLVRPRDFKRYLGHEARLELYEKSDGQRRFKGVITAADDTGAVRLKTDTGEKSFHIDDMKKAKLVMTDRLMDEAAAKQGRNG